MPVIPTIQRAFPYLVMRAFPYLVMVALLAAPSTLYATPPPIPPANTTATPPTNATTTRKPPSPRWSRVQPTPLSPPQEAQPSAPNNANLPPNHPPTTNPPTAQPKAEEAPTLNAAQIQRYQNLTTLIIAPCCWVQPVSMHPSPASDQIKLDLKKRIVSGHTDKQILDAYMKRFGERILAIPPHQDIFWLPIAAAAFILLLVFFLILVWSSRGKTPSHTQHDHAA